MFRIGRVLEKLTKANNRLQPSIRSLSQFQTETISLQDKQLYPIEKGAVVKSVYGEEITIPKCRLDQFIWTDIDQWQNKTAVVCGVSGRSYTYAQLRDHCAALAINLRTTLTLNQGDVVGLCMLNSPEFILAALGIMEAGLVLSTFNPVYTAEEISKQVVNSNVQAMICTADLYETIKGACDIAKSNAKIICMPNEPGQSVPSGSINFTELINYNTAKSKTLPTVTSDYNDLVFLPYSSGTTGLPKGVMLSHRNIISNSVMLRGTYGASKFCEPTTETWQDVFLTILPLFHIYSFTCNLTARLSQGCKLVTLPGFKPDTFLNAIVKYKPTVMKIVPPIVIFYGKSDLVKPEHGKSVRLVMSGAAPLAADDVERFWSKAPQVKFMQGYGLTETSPMTHVQAVGSTNYGSIGGPVYATQAKIVSIDDSSLKTLGPNQNGELWVRGPQIMKGYLNNEKDTNETLLPGGWLRTGDIGYYDDNNQFYITDRFKELIKVKGFQVAPAELEGVLRSHPAIADAAVIGVPDERSGEVPKGIVILRPDAKVSKMDVMEYVAGKVAKFKQLGSVEIVDLIPKTATGKILRRELKKIYVK